MLHYTNTTHERKGEKEALERDSGLGYINRVRKRTTQHCTRQLILHQTEQA